MLQATESPLLYLIRTRVNHSDFSSALQVHALIFNPTNIRISNFRLENTQKMFHLTYSIALLDLDFQSLCFLSSARTNLSHKYFHNKMFWKTRKNIIFYVLHPLSDPEFQSLRRARFGMH